MIITGILDTSDALPTINPYLVDDSTLSIDLHFGTIATYNKALDAMVNGRFLL